MKLITFLFMLIAGLFLLNSCEDNVVGSNVLVVKEFDFADFTAISADQGCEVSLVQSDTFYVEVTINENFSSDVSVSIDENKLILSLRDYKKYDNLTFKAKIHMPYFNNLDFSMGSICNLANSFEGLDILNLVLSNGSSLRGALTLSALNVVVSSGSILTAYGRCNTGNIVASDGSVLELLSLTQQICNLTCSGGSTVSVYVQNTLNVTASGGSTVNYAGNPALGNIDITDGSSLNKL